MVKELRELSGAGMSACKNALTEADGNMERAGEILREKGLAAAAKKAGRVAAEGLVLVSTNDARDKGAIVEVNSETDFVAKNQDFINFVSQVASQALCSSAANVDGLASEPWAGGGMTLGEALTQKIATIGENINIRRFVRFEAEGSGAVVDYIHGGGKVAVMAELSSEKICDALIEAGRNVCMQIAAMSPKFVSRSDIPEEFIAKEREILTQQAINEGTKPEFAGKKVEGRLNKELKEYCLLEQEYVKDGELTVASYLKGVGDEIGSNVSVRRFVRFETGEGIEKKKEDFAEEVSKAMNV